MRITVIGTGYLGAVHAACMAEIGHDVLGVDIDPERIEELTAGRAPFYEPGLDALLSRAVRSGRLRFTTALQEAGQFGDVHFICVGTPQQAGSRSADLGAINAVLTGLAPHLRRACLVAGKSTVPVGTAAQLAATLAEISPAGRAAELAWNPEFLREGHAIRDTLRPDRLVVGATSARAHTVLRAVYSPMIEAGIPYLCTDLATAELAKVAANAFLATKISFINAIADLCDVAGADVVKLSEAMAYDPRIGAGALGAGLGYGGGCLPKDIRALQAQAEELGVGSLAFLRDVDEINAGRRSRTVEVARTLCGGSLAGKHVAVLGAAFKPGSDDLRDSPALAVAAAIQSEGAVVRVHDPVAIDNARKAMPMLDYAQDLEDACDGADVVLHLTEWREYQDLDPIALGRVVRHPRIVDARNTLAVDQWRQAGWAFRGLGRAAT